MRVQRGGRGQARARGVTRAHLEHVGLALDVLDVGVRHEHQQVEDEVGRGAQDVESLAA